MESESAHKTRKAPRTAGEKWFDRSVYGGIGYAANVGISIGAMWLADRTRMGKDALYHGSHALARLTGVSAQTIRPQLRYTTLLTGGFAVLVPIKLLEDRKIELVKQYDQQHYEAIPEAAALLRAAYERLESEPRQSWSSILGSRMLAMLPFYAFTNVAMRDNQWLARQTGGEVFVEKYITQAARGMDAALHRGDANALAEIAAKNKKYPHYTVNSFVSGEMERPVTALADYTITEAITSGMVASFLYGFTRLTAPILGKAPEAKPKPFSPAAPVGALVTNNAPSKLVSEASVDTERLNAIEKQQMSHTA